MVYKILSALIVIALIGIVAFVAHDLRSGGLKEGLDDHADTSPTPAITPTPEATPIDPSLVLTVDTSAPQGETLTVNGALKQSLECKKFERVYVNSSASTVTLKGACSQIMVNGDKNHMTVDAAQEFVFNGTANDATYSRFVNGKLPTVTENQPGNTVEQASPTAAKPADTRKTK